MSEPQLPEPVKVSWALAQQLRRIWEPRWQRLYDLCMPYKPRFGGPGGGNVPAADNSTIYDETGMVAVDEFASRLQTGIMPAGIDWALLEFAEGSNYAGDEEAALDLADVQTELFRQLSRSNLAAETKDSFVDLSGPGAHCLRVMPGPWSRRLKFQAIPLHDFWLTPGPDGEWADVHVRYRLPRYAVPAQYPGVVMPEAKKGARNETEVEVIDSWVRDLDAMAMGRPERWLNQIHMEGRPLKPATEVTGEGACPYIVGRWGKNAGELYGIGQGMQAIPAMASANEIVRMLLAHGEFAMAGMWQAEDDGVLNPWSVQLVPGTIIPIAPGSKGLQPLTPQGGRMEIGQLLLTNHQHSIKKALYNEQLGPREGTPVTAFEIQERMNELARAIGPAYERVWQETVIPLLARCLRLLKEQGVVKLPTLGGDQIKVVPASAFVRSAAYGQVRRASEWAQGIAALYGPEALATQVSLERWTAWTAERMGAPAQLLFDRQEKQRAAKQLEAMAVQAQAEAAGGAAPAGGAASLLAPAPVSVL